MIFDKYANLKYKYGSRHFWAKGYYVSTVGLSKATIKKQIQDTENKMRDKESVKEYKNPFKGCQRDMSSWRAKQTSPIRDRW